MVVRKGNKIHDVYSSIKRESVSHSGAAGLAPPPPPSPAFFVVVPRYSFTYSRQPTEGRQPLNPPPTGPRPNHIRPQKPLQSQIGDGRVVVQLISLPLGIIPSREQRGQEKTRVQTPAVALFCIKPIRLDWASPLTYRTEAALGGVRPSALPSVCCSQRRAPQAIGESKQSKRDNKHRIHVPK